MLYQRRDHALFHAMLCTMLCSQKINIKGSINTLSLGIHLSSMSGNQRCIFATAVAILGKLLTQPSLSGNLFLSLLA